MSWQLALKPTPPPPIIIRDYTGCRRAHETTHTVEKYLLAVHGEAVEGVAGADDDILNAVELIADGAVAHAGT